jgi:hypothetical protein
MNSERKIIQFCNAAVLQSERGKRVGGLRVEAEGKMSKFKIQMTNDIRELVAWFHWFNWLTWLKMESSNAK